jgi:YidC/Oxa1 family membrane protein insertase
VILHLATLLASGPTTTAAAAHKSSGSILDPIAKPIAGLLAYIYGVVPNYGVAILILSVLWMILISPLTLKSTRSMLAMQKLQPQLKRLQEQHKNDRQAFAQAQMDLFREHQVSPFGSCLPMLLPMPVFFALFRVIDGLSHTVKGPDPAIHCTTAVCSDPKYLSPSTRMFKDIVTAHGHLNAFGMDLSHNAFSPHSSFAAALPFWALLLIMAGTSYLQTVQTMSRNPAAQQNPQMRMMKFLPLLFVLFCIKFPAGVILYYSMSNVCRIVQQDLMYRFDPKVKVLVAQEVQEVEAMTHDIDEREDQRRRSPGYTPPRSALASGQESAKTPVARPGGRMRFRDLLAAAAEQQQQKPKGGANGQKPGGQKPVAQKPIAQKPIAQKPPVQKAGDGQTSAAGGQRSGGNRQAGGRRNRKRRGR